MTNMVTCQVCGALNDPGNRFCDQCGARLNTEQTTTAEQVHTQNEVQKQQTVALVCTVCGAPVLHGQAFCDNCGADLRTNPPVEMAAEAKASDPSDPTLVMPSPHAAANDDTLIADSPVLSGAPSGSTADDYMIGSRPQVQQEESSPDDTHDHEVPPVNEQATPESPPASEQADDVAMSSRPFLEHKPSEGTVGADDETVIAEPQDYVQPPPLPVVPPAEPAPPAPPAADTASDQERQRLEAEIERHRATIGQLEQIINPLPAGAAPPYLVGALEEARRALEQAESDLLALPVGPDPAEVARLEEERDRHQATIHQLEQVLQVYPESTAPAYLTTALNDAHRALDQVEQALAALFGSAPAGGTPAEPAAPVSPTEATMIAGPSPHETMPETVLPSPPLDEPQTPPEAIPAPPPPAPVTGPRLIITDGNHELPLPDEKVEIIVGREDPVSYIFPEIDLTPYGGEAGGVSRQHARINQGGGMWTVTDLNSTNYTHVNGQRLEPNTPTAIEDSAQIRFGRINTIFKLQ